MNGSLAAGHEQSRCLSSVRHFNNRSSAGGKVQWPAAIVVLGGVSVQLICCPAKAVAVRDTAEKELGRPSSSTRWTNIRAGVMILS